MSSVKEPTTAHKADQNGADQNGSTRSTRSAQPDSARGAHASIAWPSKYNVCGVLISATDYAEVVERAIEAARRRQAAVCSFFAVHAVVTARGDAALKEKVNRFEVVAPDGQPVRWALNRFHGCKLRERVYGPETMLRLCRRAAEEGVSIYLYGGANEDILSALRTNLMNMFPKLQIAGSEVPPFRALAPDEDAALVERINASGAGLLLIGLGCPKQDLFAAAHRDRLSLVQCCVGAAFDFHAGKVRMAPAWMQRRGLEWLYRLWREPRRLAKRYFVTNSIFMAAACKQWLRSFGSSNTP